MDISYMLDDSVKKENAELSNSDVARIFSDNNTAKPLILKCKAPQAGIANSYAVNGTDQATITCTWEKKRQHGEVIEKEKI